MKAKFPPDSVLLISDLHLEPARPELTRAFFKFLETTAREAAALYILGDFFNVWIGDDDDAPLPGDISRALKKLSDAGTAVYLMHGNRDFLLGATWAEASGATLIHEPYLLQQGAANFLLLHGDALCTLDTDYMVFRKMVREVRWQQDFLARPLAERRAFAAEARARSKTMSSNKPDDIMDVTPEEVERVLAESGTFTLIHGHTHRPAVHTLSLNGVPATRIVLGDWGTEGWYVRVAAGQPALHRFPISVSESI